MDYDYLVFIGRFEPFHNGHAAVARYALSRARKVIFLVGSADTPRTIRNPWTVAERAVMIQSALGDAGDRLIIRPLRDHLYNESLWIAADLMVDVKPKNSKLKERCIRIVVELCPVTRDEARELLERTQWNIREAVDLAKAVPARR